MNTTYYGYNRAGELCWQGPNTGNSAQKLGRVCSDTPSGNTALTRDKAGNNTGTGAAPIEYNDRDQVTTIGGTANTYRDLGNDVRAQTGTTQTVNGPMGITATKTGTAVTFYTRDPQGTILNSHNDAGTVRNYVSEFNGSVAALYNPAGALVGSYKYAPYGGTAVYDESGGQTADNNRFRYIGGYQDTTAAGGNGHYKLGARYYDAKGHFTQPDALSGTINDPKTMTAYNYAGGDPINNSDPSGNAYEPTPICNGNVGSTGYYTPQCPSGPPVGTSAAQDFKCFGAFAATAFGGGYAAKTFVKAGRTGRLIAGGSVGVDAIYGVFDPLDLIKAGC